MNLSARIRPRRLFLLAAALATLPTSLRAQGGTGRLDVVVVDSAGAPIENVRVEVAGVRARALTNDRGMARVHAVPVGNRVVVATRIGFAPARVGVDFTAGEPTARTVTLLPQAVTVEGVAATSERRSQVLTSQGFYERREIGRGAFMTGDEIDEIRPTKTIDLFRRLRGFVVTADREGKLYLTTRRGGANLKPECTTPLTFLDGIEMPARTNFRGGGDEFHYITPETIAGIEAYASPSSIPARYNQTGSACGVVLLWSRTGPD